MATAALPFVTRRPEGRRRPLSLVVIVPVYNENGTLPAFHGLLAKALTQVRADVAVVYVDDGSNDGTAERLDELMAEDRRVSVIRLSRNFGQQAALTAGIDSVDGDAVIMMDGDGEHPPSLIPAMVEAYRAGHDVVLTRRYRDRRASRLKRWSASLFFRVINWISPIHIEPEAADFRLLSRRALGSLRAMRERHRFLRGMVAWSGFEPIVLPYEQGDRLGGISKWSVRRLTGLALDAIFSFSLRPLLLPYLVGGAFIVVAAVAAAIAAALAGAAPVPALGLALGSLVLGTGGVLAGLIGILGSYLGRVSDEVRQRPLYVIQSIYPQGRLPGGAVRSGRVARGKATRR